MQMFSRRQTWAAGALVASLVLGLPVRAQDQKSFWSQLQARGTVRVGVADAPPLLQRDPNTGKWTGYFLDVMNGFGEKLGIKVEPVETTWGNMVAGLQAGKWDIAMALNRTPERALAVNFSIPIWTQDMGVLYDKRNPLITPDMKTLEDFDKDNMTIAVTQGGAIDLTITPMIKNAKLLRLEDPTAGRLAIMSRRATIDIEDADINRITILHNPDWATQIIPKPNPVEQGIAFAVRKSVPLEELQVLDIYLEEQVANGTVQRLYTAAVKAMTENK